MIRLLVINQFASTPSYSSGAGERYYYLAPFFNKIGYDVCIISGSFNHLFKKLPLITSQFSEELIPGGTFIWVRLRKYNPEKFIGRIYSWFEFAIKLFLLRQSRPPDVVIVSSMSIFPIFYSTYLKKRYKCKVILEVRDIWPNTAVELGGISKNHPFIIFMKFVERYAYKNADQLISVLPGFKNHVEKILGYKKYVVWIPNAISEKYLSCEVKSVFLDKNYFNVTYTGAIGIANAMEYIVEAANYLKEFKNIRINIIGEGPEKVSLQNRVKELSLFNIHFFNKVGKLEVQGILERSDVCLIAWKNRDIYRFGVSANKYNDYMLAGKPIISSSNIENDPVKVANCGIQTQPEDSRAIANAIITMSKFAKEELRLLGENGRNYVLENQTYEKIARKYKLLFEQLQSTN